MQRKDDLDVVVPRRGQSQEENVVLVLFRRSQESSRWHLQVHPGNEALITRARHDWCSFLLTENL